MNNRTKGGEGMFDYTLLKVFYKKKYKSMAKFSAAIGIKPETINKKLRNESSWKNTEMIRVVEALDLSQDSIVPLFFTPLEM